MKTKHTAVEGREGRIRTEALFSAVIIALQLAMCVQLVVVSQRQARLEADLEQAARALAGQKIRTMNSQANRRRAPGNGFSPSAVLASIDPRSPVSPLVDAHEAFDDMDAFFAQVFTDFERLEKSFDMDDGWRSLMISPTLDMRESPDTYNVYFSLPGLRPQNIDVSLDGRIITIHASCTHPVYTRQYGRAATFQKRVQLPGPVAYNDQATAVWTNNALRISVPKAQEAAVVPASMQLF